MSFAYNASLLGNQQGYQGLLNNFNNIISNVNVNPYSILQTNESNNIVGVQLEDGELLIGVTGSNAIPGNIVAGPSGNITVTNGPGTIVIDSAGTSVLDNISLTDNSDQINFGTTNVATLSITPTSSYTVTIPDVGESSFVMTEGNQTINGEKTITETLILNKNRDQIILAGLTALNFPITITTEGAGSEKKYTIPDIGDPYTFSNFILSGNPGFNQTISSDITLDELIPLSVLVLDINQKIIGIEYYDAITSVDGADSFVQRDANMDIAARRLILGNDSSGFRTNVAASVPSATRTYTMTDVGNNANFILSEGAQNINGIKTYASSPIISSLTANQAVVTDASKALASLGYSHNNLANNLVQRDASGNFRATSINLSGPLEVNTINVFSGTIVTVNADLDTNSLDTGPINCTTINSTTIDCTTIDCTTITATGAITSDSTISSVGAIETDSTLTATQTFLGTTKTTPYSGTNYDLHIQNTGDSGIWLEADTNNSGESDNPQITMTQDGGQILGGIGLDSNNNMYVGTYGDTDESPNYPAFQIYTGGRITSNSAGTPPSISLAPTKRLEATDDGKINISGNGSTTGLFILNSTLTSYTPSLFSCYEEISSNVTLSGPWTVNTTISVRFKRSSGIVNVQIEDFNNPIAFNLPMTSTAFASRFRPITLVRGLLMAYNNGAYIAGYYNITTAGVMTIGITAAMGGFTGPGNAGLGGTSLTYSAN